MHGRHNHHQKSANRDPEHRQWSVLVSVPRQIENCAFWKAERCSLRAVWCQPPRLPAHTIILAESTLFYRINAPVALAEQQSGVWGTSESLWGSTVRDDGRLIRGDRRVLVQLQQQRCVSDACVEIPAHFRQGT
jgi:hypothetical protein